MCRDCKRLAASLLADRLRQVGDRPNAIEPVWKGKVVHLLELLLDETSRFDETAEESEASSLRIDAAIETAESETLWRLRDMLHTHVELLKSMEELMDEALKARAVSGDPMVLAGYAAAIARRQAEARLPVDIFGAPGAQQVH